MTNAFKAALYKLRFKTSQGKLPLERLFDFELEELETIEAGERKDYEAKWGQGNDTSRLSTRFGGGTATKTKAQTDAELRLELLAEVYEYKFNRAQTAAKANQTKQIRSQREQIALEASMEAERNFILALTPAQRDTFLRLTVEAQNAAIHMGVDAWVKSLTAA